MSQPSPDARRVVRAIEHLSTQVGRVADALTTPVNDAMTTTDDARHAAIAAALTAEHYRRAEARIVASPEEHCAAMADAVVRVLPPVVRTEGKADDAPTTADDGARVAHWRPVPSATTDVYAACRRMETRTCPPSYNGPCGDRPCARFESDDPAPWLDAAEAPADDEDQVQRWARREPLLGLLTRLQRGRTLTETEAAALRQLVENEMRDADQARRRADQADAVTAEAKRLMERRTTTLRERAERAEAARDEEERMRLALADERTQWRQRAEEAQAAIERVQQACHDLPYEHGRRILAALDGSDQPKEGTTP